MHENITPSFLSNIKLDINAEENCSITLIALNFSCKKFKRSKYTVVTQIYMKKLYTKLAHNKR